MTVNVRARAGESEYDCCVERVSARTSLNVKVNACVSVKASIGVLVQV